jgi:hypothetical protein
MHVAKKGLDAIRNSERLRPPVEFLYVRWMVVDRHNPHGRVLRDHARLASCPAAGIQHTCVRANSGH